MKILDDNNIIFEKKDLEIYSVMSGDYNPLHIDDEYSKATLYKESVVFGMLAAEMTLKKINLTSENIQIKFNHPIFINRKYRIEEIVLKGKRKIIIYDHSKKLLEINLEAKKIEKIDLKKVKDEEYLPMLMKARNITENDIEKTSVIGGEYIINNDEDDILYILQKFSSYLVGMVLPGKNALFMSCIINVIKSSAKLEKINYRIKKQNYHTILGLLDYYVEVYNQEEIIALIKIQTYVRTQFDIDENSFTQISNEYNEKTVLILGGTKGIGIEIAKYYIRRGSNVIITYHHSDIQAQKISELIEPYKDRVHVIKNNIEDLKECEKLKEYIIETYKKIDVMFLCAAQPPKYLELNIDNYEIYQDYLIKGIKMFYYPFFSYVDIIKKNGKAVIISSIAVEEKEACQNMIEYLNVKMAVENMVEYAYHRENENRQYYIIRPPQMLTEMSNTPSRRINAKEPRLIFNDFIKSIEIDEDEKCIRYLNF